jgi:hypothetical protein
VPFLVYAGLNLLCAISEYHPMLKMWHVIKKFNLKFFHVGRIPVDASKFMFQYNLSQMRIDLQQLRWGYIDHNGRQSAISVLYGSINQSIDAFATSIS